MDTEDLMSLIVKDHKDVTLCITAMNKWKVCNICILRFLGNTSQDLYRNKVQIDQFIKNHLESKGSESKDFVCVVCVGILQEATCSEKYCKELADRINAEKFEFDTYFLSLTIPVPLMLREYAVLLELKKLLPEIYLKSVYKEITPVKEVWKWINGPTISWLLGQPFSQKSLFEVKLFFGHPDLEQECNFLLDLFPNVFCRRKNKKQYFEMFTRVNVPNAINNMSEVTFRQNYTCPPRSLDNPCQCISLLCVNEAILIAGRYNKYSRELSQTPWLVDGGRRTESSIEEMLCADLKAETRCTEYKLSASGREDVDVLMLGRGRPFLVEMINPRRTKFTAEEMKAIQNRINASHKEIRCRDLQIVNKEDTKYLKEGEEEKIKIYSALCWSERTITQELLDSKFTGVKDLLLKQKTPIRVLHRRALAVRERLIHTVTAKLKDDHHFYIYLSTQAGTYIKEFVHGDFGRTIPNMCTILAADCDILELNVDCVELDWPPQLEPYDPDEDKDRY